MKKITKILSLTVVVASMMTPLALLANNSNSVNVKQEVNEVAGDATDELDNVNNDVVVDNQAIDVNSTIDNYQTVGDIISSDNCTAEDSGQTTTAWMGITASFINFTISKDYVSESNVGEVKITPVFGLDLMRLKGVNLTIPNYIVSNNEKYNVVEIGDNAFRSCLNLSGPLTISSSVTTIGTEAFFGCTGLTSLDLSNATSLTSIDKNAFLGCDGLSGTLTIPASVTTIGSDAFSFCTGLTSLDFSKADSLTTISDNAFRSCLNLSGPLTIPASITSIGNDAFAGCTGLTSLDLSSAANLKTIGNNAFVNCTGLTSLDLSNAKSLTTISGFNGCTGLKSLDLSNATSLTTIESAAFYNCTGLTGTLTIPDSVTEIGNEAFSNAGSQDFKFLSPTPPRSLGINIFGTNVTKTLWVPSAQAKIAYDQYAVDNFGLLDDSYIKFKEIAPTSVDITNLNGSYTINLNETNIPFATARADVQPTTATNKDVTWSLENAPTWLKIDASGNITADDNLKNVAPGKFTFKVKVVCEANAVSNTTGDIELNVIQQENNDSFAWWWLLVAEAGALLLIGVISISVIVVKNKKNK